jgi:hypothetical protein
MSPAEVVNEQLRAYNARDLEGFAATYADDICLYNMPHAFVGIHGKAMLTQIYRDKVFTKEGLRAEVLSRTVIGNKVIDHERTWGLRPSPVECAVVYEVEGGLITAAWFFEITGKSAEPPASAGAV